MSRYINTMGRSNLAIGICQRCRFKYALDDLSPDRDNKGLLVCVDCNDIRDPYKLPARRADKFSIKRPSPDEKLT